MLGSLLLVTALLSAPPADGSASSVAGYAPDRAATLAEYNARRARLPNTAEAHYTLGLWCEQNGLKAEAAAHFAAVTQLDPRREGAWKHLGYKRHDGRWVTDEQIEAEERQKKANQIWGPRLEKLHEALHGRKRRAGALDELARIDDPAAVPSVWNVLARGGAGDQLIAVQLFGQIDAPPSSQLLAMLAVYGNSERVRGAAAETLQRRDAGQFVPALIDLMHPLIEFEVRPIVRPGAPGELIVKGDGQDLRRVYSVPDMPAPQAIINWRKGDFTGIIASVFRREFANSPMSQLLRLQAQQLLRSAQEKNVAEWRRAAVVANQQIEADKAELNAVNDVLRQSNERIAWVLHNVTGQDLPADPKAWETWLTGQSGRPYDREPRSTRTVTQYLPLAAVPTYTGTVLVGFD